MVEHVVLLKLLDDGKTESVRHMLLANVQSDTIVVGSVATGETGQRLLRFARQAGELKSVREDTSELGSEAAKARALIPPES